MGAGRRVPQSVPAAKLVTNPAAATYMLLYIYLCVVASWIVGFPTTRQLRFTDTDSQTIHLYYNYYYYYYFYDYPATDCQSLIGHLVILNLCFVGCETCCWTQPRCLLDETHVPTGCYSNSRVFLMNCTYSGNVLANTQSITGRLEGQNVYLFINV